MKNNAAFWNGFVKGLAAPAYWAFREPARREAESDELPPPSAEAIQYVPQEFLVAAPNGSVRADMAAVYGDFLRALGGIR